MCEVPDLSRLSGEETGAAVASLLAEISPRALATLPFRLAKPSEVASVPRADPLPSERGKAVRG